MDRGRIRVLVADNHPLYRQAIVTMIEEHPELELVGEAQDGKEALEKVHELRPDVALLDERMPHFEGSEVARELKQVGSDTRVLLLSAYHDSAVVYGALGAGAAGYLSKDASGDAIFDGIVAVCRGESVLAPEIQGGVVNEIHRRSEEASAVLTPREREVMALTAEGYSAPEIGRRLHLSPTTIKTHLQSLYAKLGVSDRAAAVAEAMRRGLLR